MQSPTNAPNQGEPGSEAEREDQAASRLQPLNPEALRQRVQGLLQLHLAPDTFCAELARVVAEEATMHGVAILAYEPRRQRTRLLAAAGLTEDARKVLAGDPSVPGWDIPLRCLRNRRISVVTNAHENPFVPQPLREAGRPPVSIAAIPFYQANVPVGVIVLILVGRPSFRDATLHAISDLMRTCAEHVAGSAAGAERESPRRVIAPRTAPPRMTVSTTARAALQTKPAVAPRTVSPSATPGPESERIAQLEREVQRLRAERDRLAALEEGMRRLGEQARLAREAAEAGRAENLKLQAALARAEERAEAAANTIAALAATRDELRSQLEQARAWARERDERARELEQQLRDASMHAAQMAEAEASIAEADAARQAAQREIERLREDLDAAVSARRQFEREAHAARAESALLRRQLAELQERVESLESRGERESELSERLELMSAERTWLRQALADTRNKLAEALRDRETWTKRLADLENERDRLRDEIASLHQKAGRAPAEAEEFEEPEEEQILEGLDPAFGRELLEAFATEAGEIIQQCESLLLELEQRPDDPDVVQALFRHFHTLKGSAAAVGLQTASAQLHHGESLLEAVRDKEIQVDGARLVEFLLRLTDSVTGLIYKAMGVQGQPYRIMRNVDQEVALLRAGVAPAGEQGAGEEPEPAVAALAPRAAVDTDGRFIRVPAEHLSAVLNEIGQLDVARRQIQHEIRAAAKLRERLAEWRARLLGTDQASTEEAGAAAPVLHRLVREADHIVSEFEARIRALEEREAQFAQVGDELEQQVHQLRASPIDSVFRRLLRPVRDAARRAGKAVQLELEGGDIQLDRTIVAGLYGPLLHLVRNAVSHGIEAPGIREANGKPRTGEIRIQAERRGDEVRIVVADDGAGVDFRAVLEKARMRGFVGPEETPPRDQLLQLIFRPGFSTQDAVTELSGRGVGMDVVAQEVAALGGTVEIESTEGEGTLVRIVVPCRISRESDDFAPQT